MAKNKISDSPEKKPRKKSAPKKSKDALPDFVVDASTEVIPNLTELGAAIKKCSRCELAKRCTNHVLGVGPDRCEILLVGEGPGVSEDQSGLPFMGAAGDCLNAFLSKGGIKRADVRITNTVRCRSWDPADGHNCPPTEEQTLACRQWLWREIELVKPVVLISLGNTPLRLIAGNRKLQVSKSIGRCYTGPYDTVVVPCWHPAYYLRNKSLLVAQDIVDVFEKALRIVDHRKREGLKKYTTPSLLPDA